VSPEQTRSIGTFSIGEAWIAVARLIMDHGVASTYDGLAVREVLMTTLVVRTPKTTDDVIERFADPDRVA